MLGQPAYFLHRIVNVIDNIRDQSEYREGLVWFLEIDRMLSEMRLG